MDVDLISATPRQPLKQICGYDAFRPGQEETVAALCAGRDVRAVMPTRAGKKRNFLI